MSLMAVVQQGPDPVAADILVEAFAYLPDLTAIDARVMARDTFGIIVEQLSADEASTLTRELQARGVGCEAVPQEQVSPLPMARKLRRAAVSDQALTLYDTLGRPIPIGWDHLRLVGAGRMTVVVESERQRRAPQPGSYGTAGPTQLPMRRIADYETYKDDVEQLVLELILDCEPHRYRLQHEDLHLDGTETLSDRERRLAFIEFAAQIVTHAPNAQYNRGLHDFPRTPDQLRHYPSRHAFEEELIWLLWRTHGDSRPEVAFSN